MLRERSWKILFVGLSVGRFLSLIPFVIDDDEAWWSVAARSLSSPFEYYFRAVDHKPPGIVWFVKFFGSDPRIARAFFSLLVMLAAIAVGRMSAWLKERRSETDWRAACFFIFALALGSPKLLTVTADGVLVLFVIAAYFVALVTDFWWSELLAGALLGCALLVKQTAVFFALPILFSRQPRKWTLREILGFALGASVVYVPSVLLMDWREFFYWNWSYPREVLTRARGTAFSSAMDMFTNSLQFVVTLFPLCWFAFKARFSAGVRDFRVLWLISAMMGTFLGKGIFLHYFLLLAPPLALLAADGWREKRFLLPWLVAGYGFACLVIMLPFSGLFWGNDSEYAEIVGQKIDQIGEVTDDHTVMLWGGSSFPLAYSKGRYSGRFLLPRFAEPPYDTERTQKFFHDEFQSSPPSLIVDLHERGDNRFDNPFDSDPVIETQVARSYRLFIDPALPWAKFYLRKVASADALKALHLEEVIGDGAIKRVYSKFPAHENEWRFWQKDRFYRASNAFELIQLQSQDPSVRTEAHQLLDGSESGLFEDADRFFRAQSPGEMTLPLRSRLWWVEVAIVELQPRFFSDRK